MSRLLLLATVIAAPAVAQIGPTRPDRPFSAPLSTTATRQTAIGGVQSRVGADGRVAADDRAEPAPSTGQPRPRPPQSLAALAPDAPAIEASSVRAAAPSAERGTPPPEAKPRPRPRARRNQPHRNNR